MPDTPAPSLDLAPKFMFGLTTGVSGNCLFWNDNVLVYPVACVIVIHDIKKHTQKYIKFGGTRKIITAMDLNSINHTLAVATVEDKEESVDSENKPTISIYDLTTLNLKFVFTEPDDACGWDKKDKWPRHVSHVRFLYNNIFVAALFIDLSGFHCVMYYYDWRTSKVDTCVRIDDGHVADIGLNPIDTAICCFVGNEMFRFLTRTESEWMQYGFCEASGIDFTCVCWLCSERCLAGTTDGRVMLFKNGVLLSTHYVNNLYSLDVTFKTSNERLSSILRTNNEMESKTVRGCIAFSFGLVVMVGHSSIYYFEKTDQLGLSYVRKRIYVKSEDRYLQSKTDNSEQAMHYIQSMCVSPNGEKLTCITKRAQLYWAQLYRQEDNDDNEADAVTMVEMQPLGEHLHHGGVESMSTCLWKPILITCGKIDFTIKVWDYMECKLLLSKYYSRHVSSVSMHPCGLYSLAAFSDHVEYQMVLTNDLVPLRRLSFGSCSMSAFSTSGHLFALAKLDAIEVYCSVMFEKRFSCFGNLGAVDMLVWCNYDTEIVVYDVVGAVCMFDTKNGKLLMHAAPYSGVSYTGLAVSEDSSRMFVIAKDGILRESFERKIIREVNFHYGPLSAISISKPNVILFVATENGIILTLALPMMYQIVRKEYKMHNRSIKKMCLSMDGSVLISCSEDGSMCIWEVKNYKKKMIETNGHSLYTDDILVKMSTLEHVNNNVVGMEKVVNRLETESTEILTKLKKSKEHEIEELKDAKMINYRNAVEKNKVMVNVHNNDIRKLKDKLATLREQNGQSITSLESVYNDQLILKHAQHQSLQNRKIDNANELQKYLNELEEKLRKELLDTMIYYEESLKLKYEDIAKAKKIIVKEQNNLRLLLGNTENEVDENVIRKKNKYKDKLNGMRELYLKTMSEATDFKMKQKTFSRVATDLRNLIDSQESDIDRLNQASGQKNDTIIHYTRMLKNCNELILQKDDQIHEIEKQMKTLENDINVLKGNITILEEITDPLLLEIQKKKYIIEQKQIEYENILKTKKRLDLSVIELGIKNEENDIELDKQNKIVQDGYGVMKQMQTDMNLVGKHYQFQHDNEKAIIDFYNKYAGPTAINKIDVDEIEARSEFFRQKHCLERSFDLLGETRSFDTRNESHYLVMEENMKLISLIDCLRKEEKEYFNQYNKFKHLAPAGDSKQNILKGQDKRKDDTKNEEISQNVKVGQID